MRTDLTVGGHGDRRSSPARRDSSPLRRDSSPRYDGVGDVILTGADDGGGDHRRDGRHVAHGVAGILEFLTAGVVGFGETIERVVRVGDGRRHQLARRGSAHGDIVHLGLAVALGSSGRCQDHREAAGLGVGVRGVGRGAGRAVTEGPLVRRGAAAQAGEGHGQWRIPAEGCAREFGRDGGGDGDVVRLRQRVAAARVCSPSG